MAKTGKRLGAEPAEAFIYYNNRSGLILMTLFRRFYVGKLFRMVGLNQSNFSGSEIP